MSRENGFLEVADFVTVVRYNKEDYPKGIKYYHVKQDGAKVIEEESKRVDEAKSDEAAN